MFSLELNCFFNKISISLVHFAHLWDILINTQNKCHIAAYPCIIFFTHFMIKNYLETFLTEETIREMKHAKFITLWTKKIYDQSHFKVLFIISYVALRTFTHICSKPVLTHAGIWINSIYTLTIFVTVIGNKVVAFNIINFNNKSLSF